MLKENDKTLSVMNKQAIWTLLSNISEIKK
jgi:hypothetical protein